MSNITTAWRKDHVNFLRLLDLLEAEIGNHLDGRATNYVLMHDILYYMIHYPDVFHHPKEDLVFMKIRERDAGARAIVNELMAQHDILRESGEQLHSQLEGIINGAMMSRKSIEEPARSYIDYFRNHMKKEEMEAFPLACKLLGPEDWIAVEKAMPSTEDPVFGSGSLEREYERLQRQILQETMNADAV